MTDRQLRKAGRTDLLRLLLEQRRENEKLRQQLSEMEERLLAVQAMTEKYAAIFDEHKNMPYRVQTVAMRLMRQHTDFCAGYAGFMAVKCLGKDAEAKEMAKEFLREFGKREQAMDSYYDHYMASASLLAIVNTKSEYDQ